MSRGHEPPIDSLTEEQKDKRRDKRKAQQNKRFANETNEEREVRLAKRRAQTNRSRARKRLVAENERKGNASHDKKRPIDVTQLEEVCTLLPTKKEVAAMFGLTYSSLLRRFEDEPSLQDAYDRGIARGMMNRRRQAERMMFGYSEEVWDTIVVKTKAGDRFKKVLRTVYHPPSDKMAIFVLKNTLGWTDRHEISGAEGKPAAVQQTTVNIENAGSVEVGLNDGQVRNVKATFLRLKVAPEPEPQNVIEVTADANDDDRGTGSD